MVGRPKKNEDEKKVKFGISIDRFYFNLLNKEPFNKSKFIETLIKEHYGNKKM